MSTAPQAGIYVAPFRGKDPVTPDEWILIGSEELPLFLDKPRWSPDGNLLYFTSFRHGLRCVYAQRLDPATKHPIGDVLDVYHRHEARLSTRTVWGEIDVGPGQLVLEMAELTGNIWMMEPENE